MNQMTDYLNPEMAEQIAANPTFAALAQELEPDRTVQKMKYQYIYGIAGSLTTAFGSAVAGVYTMTIEQDSDFKSDCLLISAFSNDGNFATDFPIPGAATFAGRGLQFRITDSGASRELMNNFVPLELIGTPGYGLSLIKEFSWKYLFKRTSTIRFDVRLTDQAAAGRVHSFALAFRGMKCYTPS